LYKFIETLNKNPNYPEFDNIRITNLKDPFCKIFDGTTFIARRRTRVVDTLINNRIKDMFDLFELNNLHNKDTSSHSERMETKEFIASIRQYVRNKENSKDKLLYHQIQVAS
jgi:adenine-specific DNA methylase